VSPTFRLICPPEPTIGCRFDHFEGIASEKLHRLSNDRFVDGRIFDLAKARLAITPGFDGGKDHEPNERQPRAGLVFPGTTGLRRKPAGQRGDRTSDFFRFFAEKW
jgi:hypothetical protein